jgi:hypothetical protein
MIDASGIRTGDNPPYTLTDFYTAYPQFGQDTSGNYIVPEVVAQMYLDLANACIKEARWHKSWQLAMGWFIAHFLTLYLQGTANPDSGAGAVLKAGQAQGLQTSVSVGDVSVSTDYATIANSVNGWAGWKLTIYGQQLMQIGRLIGIGAMYVN